MNLAEERWIVTKGGDVRRAEDDKFIASVFGNGPISHLIAAAPDMLRLLIELRDGLTGPLADQAGDLIDKIGRGGA